MTAASQEPAAIWHAMTVNSQFLFAFLQLDHHGSHSDLMMMSLVGT